MTKLFYATCVVEIDAPIEKVKPMVFDLKLCERWNPGVEKVDLHQEARGGIGNSRKCIFYGGGSVDEQITKETDDTSGMVITTGKPFPMAHVGPELKVEKIDENKTKLTSTIVFLPMGMPLTKCLATGPMKKQLGEAAWRHAQGIKMHCETDEIVTDKTELPKPAVYELSYREPEE